MAYFVNVDTDPPSAERVTDHPLSAMLVSHGQSAGGAGFANISGVTFNSPNPGSGGGTTPALLGPPDKIAQEPPPAKSNWRSPSGVLFIGPPQTYDVPPAHTPTRAVLLPSRNAQARQNFLARLFGRIPRK